MSFNPINPPFFIPGVLYFSSVCLIFDIVDTPFLVGFMSISRWSSKSSSHSSSEFTSVSRFLPCGLDNEQEDLGLCRRTLFFVQTLYNALRNLGFKDQNTKGPKNRYVDDNQDTIKSTNGGAIVPVQDVMTCWIAHGVTKTMKVREMAAAHLEVVSHTLCSSKICFVTLLAVLVPVTAHGNVENKTCLYLNFAFVE